MTHEERNKIIKTFFDFCYEVCCGKNRDYKTGTGATEDANAMFTLIAQRKHETKYEALLGLKLKHEIIIEKAIRENPARPWEALSDGKLLEVLVDDTNYNAILRSMIEEDRRTESNLQMPPNVKVALLEAKNRAS